MSWWKLFNTGRPENRNYILITWRKYPYTPKSGVKAFRAHPLRKSV